MGFRRLGPACRRVASGRARLGRGVRRLWSLDGGLRLRLRALDGRLRLRPRPQRLLDARDRRGGAVWICRPTSEGGSSRWPRIGGCEGVSAGKRQEAPPAAVCLPTSEAAPRLEGGRRRFGRRRVRFIGDGRLGRRFGRLGLLGGLRLLGGFACRFWRASGRASTGASSPAAMMVVSIVSIAGGDREWT